MLPGFVSPYGFGCISHMRLAARRPAYALRATRDTERMGAKKRLMPPAPGVALAPLALAPPPAVFLRPWRGSYCQRLTPAADDMGHHVAAMAKKSTAFFRFMLWELMFAMGPLKCFNFQDLPMSAFIGTDSAKSICAF